jgi:hypothetical protein
MNTPTFTFKTSIALFRAKKLRSTKRKEKKKEKIMGAPGGKNCFPRAC